MVCEGCLRRGKDIVDSTRRWGHEEMNEMDEVDEVNEGIANGGGLRGGGRAR